MHAPMLNQLARYLTNASRDEEVSTVNQALITFATCNVQYCRGFSFICWHISSAKNRVIRAKRKAFDIFPLSHPDYLLYSCRTFQY